MHVRSGEPPTSKLNDYKVVFINFYREEKK
jgi:hypothetical protein